MSANAGPGPRVVDFHAHLVPRAVVDEAAKNPAAYGLEVRRSAEGVPVLAFDAGVRSRPLFPRLTDDSLRVQEMDRAGTDVQVIATWMEVVGYWVTGPAAVRWARLQNESLIEVARRWPGRFRVLGTLPLPDVDRSVDEVRRLGDADVRGVQIAGHLTGRELDDPALDPLWGELQEHEMVVWLHPHHTEPPPRLDRFFLHNLIGNPLDTTVAVARLIFGGVLDRFPRLRFALAHGGGYVPYQVFRLDRGAETHPECQRTVRRPSEYLNRFYFDTILFDPRGLQYLAEVVGHDRLLFGTDTPFPLGDPLSRARVEAAFRGEDQSLGRVLGRTAWALLGEGSV